MRRYLAHNIFLKDINNEGATKKEEYKRNLLSLERLVLIKFKYDFVVVPRESAWFSYCRAACKTQSNLVLAHGRSLSSTLLIFVELCRI